MLLNFDKQKQRPLVPLAQFLTLSDNEPVQESNGVLCNSHQVTFYQPVGQCLVPWGVCPLQAHPLGPVGGGGGVQRILGSTEIEVTVQLHTSSSEEQQQKRTSQDC